MTDRIVYLLIGHYTPTDADPDPDTEFVLDDGISVVVFDERYEAERELLWYQDGLIKEINV